MQYKEATALAIKLAVMAISPVVRFSQPDFPGDTMDND